jgi:hypothetical protein
LYFEANKVQKNPMIIRGELDGSNGGTSSNLSVQDEMSQVKLKLEVSMFILQAGYLYQLRASTFNEQAGTCFRIERRRNIVRMRVQNIKGTIVLRLAVSSHALMARFPQASKTSRDSNWVDVYSQSRKQRCTFGIVNVHFRT